MKLRIWKRKLGTSDILSIVPPPQAWRKYRRVSPSSFTNEWVLWEFEKPEKSTVYTYREGLYHKNISKKGFGRAPYDYVVSTEELQIFNNTCERIRNLEDLPKDMQQTIMDFFPEWM